MTTWIAFGLVVTSAVEAFALGYFTLDGVSVPRPAVFLWRGTVLVVAAVLIAAGANR